MHLARSGPASHIHHLLDLLLKGTLCKLAMHAHDVKVVQAQDVTQLLQPRKLCGIPLRDNCAAKPV